jgi:lincosamide nucleotidyltransferase A/C/D/E
MPESITIDANQSGRLWAEDPGHWRRLCAVEGCPVCESGPQRSRILAETPACWVTAADKATLSGYVCVTSKVHVVEPYELSEDEQVRFWLDAMAAARGLADVVKPIKMNYEIHGNTVPHLHMHLFPRQPDDPYVGFVIHNRAQVTRSPEELARIADGIRQRLGARGRLIHATSRHIRSTGEEIEAVQVLALLDLFDRAGVDVWVDGGWGVDALVGQQTRSHSDLDLALHASSVATSRSVLEREGFEISRDWLPTALSFRHHDGREVDLHPITPTPGGGGDQIQLDGVTRWHYDPPVKGTIGGIEVQCCPVTTQLRAHLGYEPGATDYVDMRLLRDHLGAELPPLYDRD